MTDKKAKLAASIRDLDAQIARVYDTRDTRDTILRNAFHITDAHFDADLSDWTDDDWNYNEYFSELYYETQYAIERLTARKAAMMLVGYNIARRGKPLHPDTVLKKTRHLGTDGAFIRDQMARVCMPSVILGTEPHLHAELKKRGVTLLDLNMYRMLIRAMEQVSASDETTSRNRKLDRYAAKLKLFNARIRQEYDRRNGNTK